MLDKDNDLTVSQLALRNAVDMVRVQPEGPYLVGGHSYGGAGGRDGVVVMRVGRHWMGGRGEGRGCELCAWG